MSELDDSMNSFRLQLQACANAALLPRKYSLWKRREKTRESGEISKANNSLYWVTGVEGSLGECRKHSTEA